VKAPHFLGTFTAPQISVSTGWKRERNSLALL
jgi:hypothetical protein